MKVQETKSSLANPEDIFSQYLDKWSGKTPTYHYLLFFSGGKDSSYVALKLKQMKKGKVCLFTVDNGFEGENFIDHVKQTASRLKLELKICTPPAEEFETLFRFILKEVPYDEFKEYDLNPCFFCMNYFWALGMEYAEENNIPVVVTAQNPAQLGIPPYSEVKYPDRAIFIKIVEKYEKLNRYYIKNIYEKIKLLEGYQNSPIIKKIVNKALDKQWNTRMVYPFQFLDYNVEKIIKTLEEQIRWKPPHGESIETYVSTSCQMWDIFLLLENKYGYKMRERVEFEDDIHSGRMSKERYDVLMKKAEAFKKEMRITPAMEKLLKRLNIEKDFV